MTVHELVEKTVNRARRSAWYPPPLVVYESVMNDGSAVVGRTADDLVDSLLCNLHLHNDWLKEAQDAQV